MKSLPSARPIPSVQYVFNANYGCVGATAQNVQHWIPRGNGTPSTNPRSALYVLPDTGTFLFTLSWAVLGTPLDIDSVLVEVYKGAPGVVAVGTGLQATVPPGAGQFGQVTMSLAVALGEGVSIGLLQSGTEVENGWNFCANLRSVVP